MNRTRRKAINVCIANLEDAIRDLEEVDIEAIRDEEEEALDALPEHLQGGKAQTAAGALTAAVEDIDTAAATIRGAVNSLKEARDA